jgi:DedD protein
MAEPQDVDALKRRGRRRLVGAIALVLAAVIVLPWIFDPHPRQTPPVSVRIPNEDESPFTPKVAPKPPPAAVQPKAEPKSEPKAEPGSEPKTEAPPAPAQSKPAAPKPASGDAERVRAEAALANVQFVVPVGAYADPGSVIGKLKAAKVPYYTEPVATAKGTVTRVRAGPFPSREAAERAHRQIKALGFNPGSVAARS